MKKMLFLSIAIMAMLVKGSFAQSIEPVKKINENYKEGHFLLEGDSQQLKAAMVTARQVVLDDETEYFLVRQEFDKGIFKTVAAKENIRHGIYEVDSVGITASKDAIQVFFTDGTSMKDENPEWGSVQKGQKVEIIHIIGLTQYLISHQTVDRATPVTNGMVCMVDGTDRQEVEIQDYLVPLFKGKMSKQQRKARESQLKMVAQR